MMLFQGAFFHTCWGCEVEPFCGTFFSPERNTA